MSVLRLKDLTDMYKKEMVLHGASAKEAETVNLTLFKGEILELVPGLCEAKDVKYVLLALDSEVGCALFEAYQSSEHTDRMVLAIAAAIFRRQMLVVDDVTLVFDGDLSQEDNTC